MKFISSQRAPSAGWLRPIVALATLLVLSLFGVSAFAQMAQQQFGQRRPGLPGGMPLPPVHIAVHHGGEDSLAIPAQLDTLQFFGMAASKLLMLGLGVSALGVIFGLVFFGVLIFFGLLCIGRVVVFDAVGDKRAVEQVRVDAILARTVAGGVICERKRLGRHHVVEKPREHDR